MNDEKAERIRARAHELWMAAGQPDGQADLHWAQAEQQLSAERETVAEQTDYVMQTDTESVTASRLEDVLDGDQAKPAPKARLRNA